MAEPIELLPWLSGPGAIAAWEVGKHFLFGRLKKADRLEEDAESEEAKKLDTVLTVLQRVERDLALLAQQQTQNAATVNEVKGRIDGISANHGTRIAELEKTVVELRTLLGRRRK